MARLLKRACNKSKRVEHTSNLFTRFIQKRQKNSMMAPHGKSAESHRSFLLYIDKLIPVTQIILTMFLSCIIAELVFLHAYHTIFISIVVWISCITAVVLLGMLIFRFIQWFKTSNDRLILSYAFALGLIILNCGIILAYINTTLESRPKLIPSTYASVKCQV